MGSLKSLYSDPQGLKVTSKYNLHTFDRGLGTVTNNTYALIWTMMAGGRTDRLPLGLIPLQSPISRKMHFDFSLLESR